MFIKHQTQIEFFKGGACKKNIKKNKKVVPFLKASRHKGKFKNITP